MDVKLQQTEGFDFTVVNDFRQIGVVRDPYSFGTTSKYTGSTARQTKVVKINTNSGNFLVDERIYQTIPAQTINSISRSSNTLTVTTAAAHQLETGQTVDITGGTMGSGATNTGHTAVSQAGFIPDVSGNHVDCASGINEGFNKSLNLFIVHHLIKSFGFVPQHPKTHQAFKTCRFSILFYRSRFRHVLRAAISPLFVNLNLFFRE